MIDWIVRWTLEHSAFLTVYILVLAVVVYLLERRIRKMAARIHDLKESSKKFEEELEEEAIQPPPNGGPSPPLPARHNWDQIKAHWRVVRDRLEELISEVDGRRQRTYDKTPRFTYKPIIDMLREDGQITAHTATYLHSMNAQYLGLRKNARTVPDQAVREFMERFNVVAGVLKVAPPPPPDYPDASINTAA